MPRSFTIAAFVSLLLVAGFAPRAATPVVAQVAAEPPSAALDRYDFDAPASEWALPRRLREISGLAFSPDGRLFAHDDERAVIYELDFRQQELVKAWAFGDTPAPGDFEGIAVADDRVWLVTSDGRIYEGTEAADDDRVLFNTYGTGVGRDCEVEGLAYEPRDDTLLLLCKTARTADLADFVGIYRWSIETRSLVGPRIRVRVSELTPSGDDGGFRASGIERDPTTGHYLLIAGGDERIAEVTRTGTVVRVVQWSARQHPQPEGVTVGLDGTLFVADEGGGRRGRLTTYRPRPD